jgi:plasmid maintenance system killer protein
MDIYVSDNSLRKAIEDKNVCVRRYGADMTKKILLRLTAFRAAESLADFWPPKSGPERCHELKGESAGTFSVDLKQPYRLLFKPGSSPPASNDDELQRWKAITSIDILAIEDTHG